MPRAAVRNRRRSAARGVTKNIINLGGEHHGRLRQLVNPALAPRAIDRYRPAMRAFLQELFDRLPADGSCEFIEELAKPYPSMVIARVMGAPLSDAPELYRWSNWIQRQFDPVSLTTEREAIEQAVGEFYAYEDELTAARRRTLREDLISDLIRSQQEGDRLSNDELRNLILKWREITFPPGTSGLVSAWHGNREGPDGDSFEIAAKRPHARLSPSARGFTTAWAPTSPAPRCRRR